MADSNGLPGLADSAGELLRHGHRTMPSSGTTNCDRQVALPFGVVAREDRLDQGRQLRQKVDGFGPLEHIRSYLGVQPSERPQVFVPVRVGEESNIHHDVGVHWQTMLVAERFHRNLKSLMDLIVERPEDFGLQLVDIEISGIDHQVAVTFHRLEKRPLHFDRLEQTGRFRSKRMPTTRSLVPLHQFSIRRIEIQNSNSVPCGAHVRNFGHQLQMLPPSHERQSLHTGSRNARQFDDRVDERRRKIVDHVPAEVFEDGCSGRTAGPGQSGDHQDVCHERHPTDSGIPRRESPSIHWPPEHSRCRASHLLGGSQVEQPGNRRSCLVLDRSFEKPLRRGWLQHPFDEETVVDESVHVPAQRTVNERNEDSLFDLLDREVFHQVRPDPPVLLRGVENLIVDPSAARSLQQWMIEKEAESATRLEHSCNFGYRLVDILDVLENEAGNDSIEDSIGKGHPMCRCPGSDHPSSALGCDRDLIPCGIDSDHEPSTESCGESGHLSVAATDVEHTVHTLEFCCRQGKNLLDVFRVGSLGESIDPPGSVIFPQTVRSALAHESRLGATVRFMNSSLRFSIWPSPERDWNELEDLAEYADSADWHALWYADHFMPNTGDESIVDGSVHECWSVIAAITAVTSRLRIGSLVSPTTFRHPAILAKTASTIDRIGGGRLILGLGAGWQINEHIAYGVDLLSNRDRVDRFEEAIRIVRSLLDQDRTSFSGEHFTVSDAPCQPRPIQTPLPILVGTGGPRMSRIAAAHADQWNTWGNVAEASTRLAAIRRACEEIGRDPATLHTSVQALFFLVDDPTAAAKIAERAPHDRSIIGNPDRIAESLHEYREAGFDEVIFPDFTLGGSPATRREAYERIASDVIPLAD